jgi:hypothetical protein
MRLAFDQVVAENPWASELIRTFRSGQLLATPNLVDVVAERFDIDLSIPDLERGGPYGGVVGCRTVHPFLFRGLLEIPLTLPQDVYLREVFRLNADATLAVWQQKLALIKRFGGVAVLNVHPVWVGPGHRDTLDAFIRFVTEAAKDKELLVTTPGGVRDLLISPSASLPERVYV